MSQVRFVALGDSYTIGTAVSPTDRWPDVLVEQLRRQGVDIVLSANLAVNGYTSGDVIRMELPALDGVTVDLASLLIGVNDVVQGVPRERYAANIEQIMDKLLERLPANRIVTVSTPDYTVTPAGADFGEPAARSASIRAFNLLLAAASHERGIAHVDIHDLSLNAATDRSLVADDGLHPSGIQYAMWVERIEPVVVALLADPAGPD